MKELLEKFKAAYKDWQQSQSAANIVFSLKS